MHCTRSVEARDVAEAILLHPVMYLVIHKWRTLCLTGLCHQFTEHSGDVNGCEQMPTNPDR